MGCFGWPCETHGWWWSCGAGSCCLEAARLRTASEREQHGPGFRRGRRARPHTRHPLPPGGAGAASWRGSRRGRSDRAHSGRAGGRVTRPASCYSSSTEAGARPKRSAAAPAPRGACPRGRARATAARRRPTARTWCVQVRSQLRSRSPSRRCSPCPCSSGRPRPCAASRRRRVASGGRALSRHQPGTADNTAPTSEGGRCYLATAAASSPSGNPRCGDVPYTKFEYTRT